MSQGHKSLSTAESLAVPDAGDWPQVQPPTCRYIKSCSCFSMHLFAPVFVVASYPRDLFIGLNSHEISVHENDALTYFQQGSYLKTDRSCDILMNSLVLPAIRVGHFRIFRSTDHSSRIASPTSTLVRKL